MWFCLVASVSFNTFEPVRRWEALYKEAVRVCDVPEAAFMCSRGSATKGTCVSAGGMKSGRGFVSCVHLPPLCSVPPVHPCTSPSWAPPPSPSPFPSIPLLLIFPSPTCPHTRAYSWFCRHLCGPGKLPSLDVWKRHHQRMGPWGVPFVQFRQGGAGASLCARHCCRWGPSSGNWIARRSVISNYWLLFNKFVIPVCAAAVALAFGEMRSP